MGQASGSLQLDCQSLLIFGFLLSARLSDGRAAFICYSESGGGFDGLGMDGLRYFLAWDSNAGGWVACGVGLRSCPRIIQRAAAVFWAGGQLGNASPMVRRADVPSLFKRAGRGKLFAVPLLAFVPLGVLLPFAAERFRKCRLALLAFAGTVLATETWQLMARRGDPDVDDLLHGLAGSLLGYFLVRFCLDLFKQKKLRLSLLLQALAIPAVFAAGIGTAFAVYILQPYGNLPISPIVRQDMSGVSIELTIPLAEEAGPAPVYRYTLAGDKERGRAVLSWVSALTRIQFEAPPAGRSSFSVSDASGEARFWYDGMDGSWRYWKPSRPGGRLSASEISTKREMLEGWLDSHGLLPGQVSMTIPGGSFFQWAVENAPIDESGVRYSGYCTAEFADDGSICRLVCSIRPTKETAAEPILSPKEAFEQISSGNFRQYITFSQGDQLYVEECSLVYMTDSKGFDQPCYLFGGACLQEDGTSRYWNAYCGAVRR